MNDGSSIQEPLVHMKDLWKTFHVGEQKVEVLKGLSLDIPLGEFLCIQGASGVGKSTLLHLLAGLDRPDSGSLEVRVGENTHYQLGEMTESGLNKFRNQQVGLVFQFHHLLPEFTALENVCMPSLIQRVPKPEAEKKASRLLDQMGLSERIHHKPNQLSGGEAQRVAIARALINQPTLLLMDEPTGNLDRERSEQLFSLVSQLHQDIGITIILVTHDEHFALQANKRVQLVGGVIQNGEFS